MFHFQLMHLVQCVLSILPWELKDWFIIFCIGIYLILFWVYVLLLSLLRSHKQHISEAFIWIFHHKLSVSKQKLSIFPVVNKQYSRKLEQVGPNLDSNLIDSRIGKNYWETVKLKMQAVPLVLVESRGDQLAELGI